MPTSQRRALESELEHKADHDDLTGLANRRRFTQQLQQALDADAGACRVVFLDLDRFKAVNDSLGHAAGDALLITTAHRLRTALHPKDTVARLGGDEFAVLLGRRPAMPALDRVHATLAAALEHPVPLNDLDVSVTASIGVAQGQAGDTIEDLLHRADTKMYAHKARTQRRASATPHPRAPLSAP